MQITELTANGFARLHRWKLELRSIADHSNILPELCRMAQTIRKSVMTNTQDDGISSYICFIANNEIAFKTKSGIVKC